MNNTGYQPATGPGEPAAAPLGRASASPEDPVKALHRIADHVIGGNAPWLADELHHFADRLAAEMRGECQWKEAPKP